MVTGDQNLRHLAALPFGGPRVVGILQQSPLETLVLQRLLRPDHAGQKPHRGIDQGECRRLAAGEDEIAEADLLDIVRLQHPLIHALEPAAQKGQRGARRVAAHHRLIQRSAARGEVHHRRRSPMPRAYRAIDNFGHQHHAGAAAKRGVVHGAVFIACEIPNVHRFQRPNARSKCLSGQGMAQITREHLGKQGQYRRRPRRGCRRLAHSSSRSSSFAASSKPAGGSTTTRPPAISTTGTTGSVNGRLTTRPSGRRIASRSPAP